VTPVLSSVPFAVLLGIVLVASLAGTWAFVRYARRARLFDIPNARSSHVAPVPRGGGLVFSIVTLVALVILSINVPRGQGLPTMPLIAIAAILLLGFLDDRLSLPALLRLGCQIALVVFAVLSLGTVPPVTLLAGIRLESGVILIALFTVGIVWLVNLYNFMDGIDALAAGEALFVALGGAMLCWVHGEVGVAASLLVLAASLVGFLVWNFPPAKVFMGDAGSVFLGFFFGIVMLVSHVRGGPDVWVWLILLGTFCVDATVTLLRRIYFGQRPMEAHRTHAYQYLSRRYASHGRVSAGAMAINVCWLLPWAYVAAQAPDSGLVWLAIAYAPLVVLAVKVGAGTPERPLLS